MDGEGTPPSLEVELVTGRCSGAGREDGLPPSTPACEDPQDTVRHDLATVSGWGRPAGRKHMSVTPGALAASALVLASAVVPSVASAAVSSGTPTTSRAYSLTRARQVVSTRVLGRSVQGRAIVAYEKGNPAARRTVVLLGQMHGNEPAGPVTARYVRDRLPVDSDVHLWIVPTMNPDGAARHTRRNAHGVDLNRNWPTDGWRYAERSPRSSYYRGPSAGSEPEVKAVARFLRAVRPDLITSLHQPFASVDSSGKAKAYAGRLARELRLPTERITVGTPSGRTAPTMTSWYNAGFAGGAVTVEYAARPSRYFTTVRAGNGILRASYAGW
ncbi:MAG: hypothetical protein JWR42_1866 [Marmoricola sp.]|nr:hypothetical protein [Marmoricola sp.]